MVFVAFRRKDEAALYVLVGNGTNSISAWRKAESRVGWFVC